MYQDDATKKFYASNTWEKKTVSFVGNTANGVVMMTRDGDVQWDLGGGSNRSDGTLRTLDWRSWNYVDGDGNFGLVSCNTANNFI